MWRLFRIRKDRVFFLASLGIAVLAGVFALGYWYFVSPTTLTVAVGPRGGVEERLMRAFAQALVDQKRDVRLRVLPFDDVRKSAEALQAGRADLAVVRPDVLLPNNGGTVAILRDEALIFAAPKAGKIDDLGDLAGKRLGVVSHHEADLPAIAKVLEHYELAAPNLTLVPLARDEVEESFAQKRIDALGFIAALASAEAGGLMRVVAKVSGGKVAVVGVDEAEALAQKRPALSTFTIAPGSLGGRPKTPEEDVKTLAVSYRLMARMDADRVVIAKVAQHLFQLRPRVAQTEPAIDLMKAPETETSTSAALPNHQGAIDYYFREQRSFMDRYGDWIWIALFAGGGLSSAFAWIGQLFARKRRELVDQVLDRVLCILSEARGAKTVAEVDGLAMEIDGLVTHAVRHARKRTTGTKTMGALMLAIDSARAAIADRRRDILDDAAAPSAPRLAPAPRSGTG